MADKPIGTIFVELDLDASRYTKGQRQLLKDAQISSTVLEKNFQNLGIKSAATMDLMRAKIINSFNAIASSSKSTANDIIRAEEAKNAKLKALNDKQFGEQASLIESIKKNWLAAAGAVYASYRMIGQAFEMAKVGSMLEKQSVAFGNLAGAAGTSSARILASLRAVSDGMVADADLMASAGKAMLMSIPVDKITELMKIAAATSRMTGQSITEAFSDITMGVARQSRMILDNLGIIVDVDKANQDYAKALGKTSDSLSEVEKKQAFMNATLKAGADMIARLGDKQGELEGVNKLVAAQSNLWAEVNKTVAQLLDKELSAYAKMLVWIDEKLKSMRVGAADVTRTDMLKEIEMLRSLESKGMAKPGSTMAKMAEYNRRFVGASESEMANQAAYKEWQKPDAMAAWREREGNWSENTAEENKKILEAMAAARKKFEDDARKSLEVNKEFWEDYKKETLSALEFEKFKLDDQYKEYQKYVSDKNALNAWYFRESMKLQQKGMLDESTRMVEPRAEAAAIKNLDARIKAEKEASEEIRKQKEAMAKADQELNEANWWKTYIEDTEDATRANEIFTDSMNIMSQSAADAFAEFVTGTKNAKEAFTSMAQSMISAMVRISSQKAFEEIFSWIATGASSLVGGFAGAGSTPTGMGTNTIFSGGGTMGGYMSTVKHSGGLMTESGPTRMVPSVIFANAPRYHSGLSPEEIPAILKRDEGVFTPGQMKALGNRSLSINVPVSITSGPGYDDRRLSLRMRDEMEATAKRVLAEEMR
jgi:hypothetical protein